MVYYAGGTDGILTEMRGKIRRLYYSLGTSASIAIVATMAGWPTIYGGFHK